MAAPVKIPDELRARHRTSAAGRAWLDRLPRLIEGALYRWRLAVDLPPGGTPWHGHTAIVVPVRTAGGRTAALKISFPFDEALLEPVALKLWDGHGAVRMLDRHVPSCSMVLERLDAGRSLLSVPIEEATEVWGTIMRQLSIPAGTGPAWGQLPHIAATAERYSDELPQRWHELNRPFPRWLLEAALEVCQVRGAVGRRSANDVLVHTDLHYANILSTPDGGSFLAIDPQPSIGEAEFAVAPCLWNRLRDLPARTPEAGLRRRCGELAAAAGLDAEAAAQWAVVREVENALWYLAKPGRHKGDAERSLWVAGTMAGRQVPGLPEVSALKMLD